MTGALAIGAVSAVLRDLLDNGLVDAPQVGPVKVTAVAPDTIKLDGTQGERRLNLFLYRVTPNQGWRNAALPAYGSNGSRLTNPPLGLDLHFLVTAYGDADFEAEILLGYAMQVLHERPVLDRDSIRSSLGATSLGSAILPPAYLALTASELADQLESVTVTLEPMDTEEMSKLWSAIQTHYRPSSAYVASVVLIQATQPAREALPVLSRGPVDPATRRDRGPTVAPDLLPPLPTITRVFRQGHERQPAMRLGETLVIEGHHLDGASVVIRFRHPLLDSDLTVSVGTNTDRSAVEVALPSGSAADASWPAGIWAVSLDLVRPGETVTRASNAAAMLLAPVPVLAPTMSRAAGTRAVTVTLEVHPDVRGSQRATLAIDGDVAMADPHPTTTDTLTFQFGNIPSGASWLRLTVDGVDSLLVDRDTTPPRFDPTQSVPVPS